MVHAGFVSTAKAGIREHLSNGSYSRSKCTFEEPRKWTVYIFFACLILFLFLAIGNLIARAPWWDEGLFSDIALSFRKFGHLGSSVLAPDGYVWLPEVNHYTYWQMPLYLVALGTWLRFVPFNIEDVRLFSTFWGLLYIAAWYLFVYSIAQSRRLAFFVASLIALDYSLISASSNGRMDMMCAALGQLAAAAYASMRQYRWALAINLAAWLGAAALFCHPIGLLASIYLVILVLLDRFRIDWRAVLLALVPYLVGVTLCFTYVSEAPNIYWAQSIANSSYRIGTPGQILHHFIFDLQQRYFVPYFLGEVSMNRLKIFCLLFGLSGVVALLANQRLRALPISRTLLILSAASYAGLAILDNQTQPVYLIYSMPYVTACGAVWIWFEKRGSRSRTLAGILLTAYVIATLGAFSYKIYKNDYRSIYLPAMTAIKASEPDGGIIMGGSELGFTFGFDHSHLVDDRYLGYSSRIEPQVYVVNFYYGEFEPAHFHQAWEWSRRTLRNRYHLVFSNSGYRVYQRDSAPPGTLNASNRKK
jgi:hypothetical protein